VRVCVPQRLHRELPLTAEELENVFDSLNTDQNGYLTLEVFSSGFSEFPIFLFIALHSISISIQYDFIHPQGTICCMSHGLLLVQ
jgi:hypothetical protein